MSTSLGRDAKSPPVVLRLATASDAAMVFQWRNDPFIVARASSQRAVARDEHDRWFAAAIADVTRVIQIIECGGAPVGLLRHELVAPGRAVISVYLLEAHTRKGIGLAAIQQGTQVARERLGAREILACVRSDNLAGQRSFRKAGFKEIPAEACGEGHRAFLLSLDDST